METNSIIARGVPSGFQLSSERVYTEENTSHHGYHRLHEHTPGRRQKGAKAIRELRRLLGELYGTFFLTFMGALVIVLEAFHPERVPYGLSGVTASLTLVALIYSEAQISGAHFNPAVTWAFFISGAFKWWRVPLYWMAEVGGATLAAFVLRCLFGTKKGQVGATMPAEDVSDLEAYCFEAIFTFLLVTTIVNTSRRAKVIGPHAALAVGAAHTALTLTGVELTMGSMNPARSLGPAIFAGSIALSKYWIYLAGPATGATAAAIFSLLISQASGKMKHIMKHEATGQGNSNQFEAV